MSEVSDVISSVVVERRDFLAENYRTKLINYIERRKDSFADSTVTTGDKAYRVSKVLYDVSDWGVYFRNRVEHLLDEVLGELGEGEFEAGEFESQITSTSNGHFRVHNDNGSAETASRVLTYVYYLQSPGAGIGESNYSGGNLRVYDSVVRGGYYQKADSYRDIVPEGNKIVFFLSRNLHEVLDVRTESEDVMRSRLTVNGWLRHK